MGAKRNNGFTVIEVMLFLAVSMLLFVAMLVGFQTAIQNQRYIDSVVSLRSFIQSQYAQVFTTVNDRSDAISCSDNATLSQDASAPARGMSECIIIGRYITSNEDGTELTASNVIARQHSASGDEINDQEDIVNNYSLWSFEDVGDTPELQPSLNIDTYPVGWGGKIVKDAATSGKGRQFSMMILRSPKHGMLLTFFGDATQLVNDANQNRKTTAELLATHLNQTQQDLCVTSTAGFNGRPLSGPMMAVRINPGATNQGGIETPPQAEAVCGQ